MPTFVRQSHLVNAAAWISASSEEGMAVEVPVRVGTGGGVTLGATGVPVAVKTLDVELVAGGNASGYSTMSDGRSAAAAIWREDGATDWQGWSDPASYLQCARTILPATGGTTYPYTGTPRALRDGSVGFVYVARTTLGGAVALKWAKKEDRWSDWTHSTILAASTGNVNARPEAVVLPDGRVVVYFTITDGTNYWVTAYSSTDHGATWARYGRRTRITGTSTRANVCAEYVAGSVGVVLYSVADGEARVWWSGDGGVSFGEATGAAWRHVRTASHGGMLACLVCDDGTEQARYFKLPPGGGVGAASGLDLGVAVGLTFDPGGAPLALVSTGDALHAYMSTDAYASTLYSFTSTDGGATWLGALQSSSGSGGDEVSRTLGAAPSNGLASMSAGFCSGWAAGAVLMVGVTESAGAADTLLEMWWGGFDTISDGVRDHITSVLPYSRTFLPFDEPSTMGWTRNDIGAGGAVSLGAGGVRLVSTGTDATSYTAPSSWWTDAGDTHTLRAVVRVTTGSTSNDGTVIRWRKNGYRLTLRLGTNALNLRDSAGSLASVTTVTSLDRMVEVMLSVDWTAHKASCWYRIEGAGWQSLASGVTVAADAGADELTFGALAAVVADMRVDYLGLSLSDFGRAASFTNPDDLDGRPLGPISTPVLAGIGLTGIGAGGRMGDAWTVTARAVYGARKMWANNRPSCMWRTEPTNAAENAVAYAGAGSVWNADTAILVGTNVPEVRVQFHTSDSWGSPAYSYTLEAKIEAPTLGTSGKGYLRMASDKGWARGEFRSRKGRRFYVEVPGLGATYEIADNDSQNLYIPGVDLSAASGVVTIFGDRMAKSFAAPAGCPYVRLYIPAATTATGYYTVGTFILGQAMELNVKYDSGFTDSLRPSVSRWEARGGQRWAVAAAAPRHHLSVAWGPLDAETDGQEEALRAFWSGTDVVEAFGFWRDETAPYDCGVYSFDSDPFSAENIIGEGDDGLSRVRQLVLREEV